MYNTRSKVGSGSVTEDVVVIDDDDVVPSDVITSASSGTSATMPTSKTQATKVKNISSNNDILIIEDDDDGFNHAHDNSVVLSTSVSENYDDDKRKAVATTAIHAEGDVSVVSLDDDIEILPSSAVELNNKKRCSNSSDVKDFRKRRKAQNDSSSQSQQSMHDDSDDDICIMDVIPISNSGTFIPRTIKQEVITTTSDATLTTTTLSNNDRNKSLPNIDKDNNLNISISEVFNGCANRKNLTNDGNSGSCSKISCPSNADSVIINTTTNGESLPDDCVMSSTNQAKYTSAMSPQRVPAVHSSSLNTSTITTVTTNMSTSSMTTTSTTSCSNSNATSVHNTSNSATSEAHSIGKIPSKLPLQPNSIIQQQESLASNNINKENGQKLSTPPINNRVTPNNITNNRSSDKIPQSKTLHVIGRFLEHRHCISDIFYSNLNRSGCSAKIPSTFIRHCRELIKNETGLYWSSIKTTSILDDVDATNGHQLRRTFYKQDVNVEIDENESNIEVILNSLLWLKIETTPVHYPNAELLGDMLVRYVLKVSFA